MVAKVLVFLACFAACQAFLGSGDDQYMKKFAYRKVYESCFGMAVVKQIRREKHEAIAKCRRQTTVPPTMTPAADKVGGGAAAHPPSDGPEPRPDANPSPVNMLNHFPAKKRPSVSVGIPGPLFDHNKLQELFGLKSQSGYIQAQQHHPLQQSPTTSPHQSYHPFSGHFASPTAAFPQSFPQQFPVQPFSGQQFAMSPQTAASLIYPFSSFYPQQGYTYPQAVYAQSQFFPFGVYQNARQRASRNVNIQNQLDNLNRAIGVKADNVSCHLQELGYLDDNLEPDYEQITERLRRLPIEEELKRDMMDGMEFCKRFSQCMPDMRKDESKFAKDQDRQMFFFSCYKHKKLEACLMKDVRERFMSDDPLTGEELTPDDLRSLPRTRKSKMPDFGPAQQQDLPFHDDDDMYFV